jgi:hypothetical protein
MSLPGRQRQSAELGLPDPLRPFIIVGLCDNPSYEQPFIRWPRGAADLRWHVNRLLSTCHSSITVLL